MGVLFGQSPLIYLILELQRYPSYYALRKERVHSKPNCPDLFLFLPALHKQLLRANETNPSEEKRSPCGRKKTFFRRAKNFRAHAGKFLCAQKNIFVRTKIYFLPQGNFTLCGRRLIPLHNKQLGEALKTTLPPPACSSERGSK